MFKPGGLSGHLPAESGPVKDRPIVRHAPALVPAELVRLTKRLGEPARDMVCVAEGNTSVLTDEGLVIKASGAQMSDVTAQDFVVVDVERAVEILHRPNLTQRELERCLRDDSDPANERRASIETLMHVAVIWETGASWVAHTHPTVVVGLASVLENERMWLSPLFPDEAVTVGEPVWIPYMRPGLELARGVGAAISAYTEIHNSYPRLMILANHGIVALGGSAQEVDAVSTMAVKAARARLVARAFGDPHYLDPIEAGSLQEREDEVARRARFTAAGRESKQ